MRVPSVVRHTPLSCGVLAFLASLAAPLAAEAQSQSQAPPPDVPALEKCAVIGAPADRLACYDKAMSRAPAPAAPPAYVENAPGGAPAPATAPAPASSSLLAPKNAVVNVAADKVEQDASLMLSLIHI